jgi:hypothetical protein
MANPFLEDLKGARGVLDAEFKRNKNWNELLRLVNNWFATLKKWEGEDDFETAYRDHRMTMRITKVAAQKGNTKPGSVKQLIRPDPRGPYMVKPDSEMVPIDAESQQRLDRQGIKDRFRPGNFARQGDKYKLGLLDVLATLLANNKLILKQGYTVNGRGGFAVFVPVPLKEDLALFYTLNDWAKTHPEAALRIREIRNSLTRLKLGQSSDMHSGFAKVVGRNDGRLHYRYGYYGTKSVKDSDTRKDKQVQVNPDDLRRRISIRTEYESIVSEVVRGDRTYNEIVLAYREHGNPLFPLFVDWPGHDDLGKDNPDTRMTVTDENGRPRGLVLTNNGRLLVMRLRGG